MGALDRWHRACLRPAGRVTPPRCPVRPGVPSVRSCMARSRTNIELDDAHVEAIKGRYGARTKTAAVDLALRHLAGQPMTRDEALAIRAHARSAMCPQTSRRCRRGGDLRRHVLDPVADFGAAVPICRRCRAAGVTPRMIAAVCGDGGRRCSPRTQSLTVSPRSSGSRWTGRP